MAIPLHIPGIDLTAFASVTGAQIAQATSHSNPLVPYGFVFEWDLSGGPPVISGDSAVKLRFIMIDIQDPIAKVFRVWNADTSTWVPVTLGVGSVSNASLAASSVSLTKLDVAMGGKLQILRKDAAGTAWTVQDLTLDDNSLTLDKISNAGITEPSLKLLRWNEAGNAVESVSSEILFVAGIGDDTLEAVKFANGSSKLGYIFRRTAEGWDFEQPKKILDTPDGSSANQSVVWNNAGSAWENKAGSFLHEQHIFTSAALDTFAGTVIQPAVTHNMTISTDSVDSIQGFVENLITEHNYLVGDRIPLTSVYETTTGFPAFQPWANTTQFGLNQQTAAGALLRALDRDLGTPVTLTPTNWRIKLYIRHRNFT